MDQSDSSKSQADSPRIKTSELLPLVYDELRRLAAAKMARENPGHTLDATGLVHEVFLKLGSERSFDTKADFFQAAAEAMRRILIDHARARKASKRGGGRRVAFDIEPAAPLANDDIEALDEALEKLKQSNPQVANLFELRRFAGLTLAECAEILGISDRTADTWWAYGRAWLAVEMQK